MNPAPDAGGRLTRTLPGRFYHDPAASPAVAGVRARAPQAPAGRR